MQYEVIHYEENGLDVFMNWRKSLRDKVGKMAIDRRLLQVEEGNFGDHHYCRDGVWELVINTGPGYRIYYSMAGKFIVLLLCAGSKRNQQKDINQAVEYLKSYKEDHK